jgi:hypothetical protein
VGEARLQRQLDQQPRPPEAESANRGAADLDAILAEIIGALENGRGVLAHAVENFPRLEEPSN